MVLEITSKDIMIFTEIKGTPLRGFPFWCEPWRLTWKIRSLALRPPQRVPHWSNLDRPFCKYLAQQVVRQYLRWWLASERVSGQPRNFPKFRQVVGVSMANFGHKTPPTPRKGIIDRLRRKSASDWYVTLSLLDQNWAYFSILKFQDHIFGMEGVYYSRVWVKLAWLLFLC